MYLKEMERCKIETMLKDGLTQREIARRLNRHYNTINYEIKKGRVKFFNTDLTTREEYCFDVGQRIHEENCANKGRPLKIANDMEYVHFVEDKILNDRYSPYAVTVVAKGKFKTDVCTTTLYSYIDKGLFLNVTNKDLIYKRRKKKKTHKLARRKSLKGMSAKSIEDRPDIVNDRTQYGHWEMDTVVGKKCKNDGCLLVLTERLTLDEITLKLKDKTTSCVVDALNELERAYGADEFRKRFLTITSDNGNEFADTDGIVKNGRTDLYYAHPYAPHERGRNENQNKLIRRWSPKGKSLKDFTNEDARRVQDWMNNYPRKIFGGLSSAQYKQLVT